MALAQHAGCTAEFCRNGTMPGEKTVHPGPCRGWKDALRRVAPGALRIIEEQRIAGVRARREAKIKALEAAGKKIPAYLRKPLKHEQVEPDDPNRLARLRPGTRALIDAVRRDLPRDRDGWLALTSTEGTDTERRKVDRDVDSARSNLTWVENERVRFQEMADRMPPGPNRDTWVRANLDRMPERIRLAEEVLKNALTAQRIAGPAKKKRDLNYPTDPNGARLPPPKLVQLQERVQAAGEALRSDIETAIAADPQIQKLRTFHQATVNVSRDYNSGLSINTRMQARVEAKRYQYQIKQRELEITMDALSQLRSFDQASHTKATFVKRRADLPIGSQKTTLMARPDARERLALADQYFPDDWTRISDRTESPLSIVSARRAFFQPWGRNGGMGGNGMMAMNTDRGAAGVSYDGSFPSYVDEVTVHEMGHRMEQQIPGITALEFAYVRSRTTHNGEVERTRKLKDLRPGSSYDASEISYPDAFADAYTGKTYEGSDPANSPWEVFQVGLQQSLGRGEGRYGDDTLTAFTLGVLATVHTDPGN